MVANLSRLAKQENVHKSPATFQIRRLPKHNISQTAEYVHALYYNFSNYSSPQWSNRGHLCDGHINARRCAASAASRARALPVHPAGETCLSYTVYGDQEPLQ